MSASLSEDDAIVTPTRKRETIRASTLVNRVANNSSSENNVQPVKSLLDTLKESVIDTQNNGSNLTSNPVVTTQTPATSNSQVNVVPENTHTRVNIPTPVHISNQPNIPATTHISPSQQPQIVINTGNNDSKERELIQRIKRLESELDTRQISETANKDTSNGYEPDDPDDPDSIEDIDDIDDADDAHDEDLTLDSSTSNDINGSNVSSCSRRYDIDDSENVSQDRSDHINEYASYALESRYLDSDDDCSDVKQESREKSPKKRRHHIGKDKRRHKGKHKGKHKNKSRHRSRRGSSHRVKIKRKIRRRKKRKSDDENVSLFEDLSPEDAARMRTRYEIRFQSLREKYKYMNIPALDENIKLDEVHNTFMEYYRLMMVQSTANQYKIYLSLAFLGLEVLCIKIFNLRFGGFTNSQLQSFSQYDSILLDVADMLTGEGDGEWPWYMRFMFVIGLNILVFVGLKYVGDWVGEGIATSLQSFIMKLINRKPPEIDEDGIPEIPDEPTIGGINIMDMVGNLAGFFGGGGEKKPARRRPRFTE
jgi:hypothetical protein